MKRGVPLNLDAWRRMYMLYDLSLEGIPAKTYDYMLDRGCVVIPDGLMPGLNRLAHRRLPPACINFNIRRER